MESRAEAGGWDDLLPRLSIHELGQVRHGVGGHRHDVAWAGGQERLCGKDHVTVEGVGWGRRDAALASLCLQVGRQEHHVRGDRGVVEPDLELIEPAEAGRRSDVD